jgi:Na+-translocating ferredoxin:NAD+ oxidoreductase RnfC subunit
VPASPICRCGCSDALGAHAHVAVAALADEDFDRALQAGLLTCQSCVGCTPTCTAALLAARNARRDALAARERFHARQARLARRHQQRADRRAAPTMPSDAFAGASPPSLPTAAAAALARAKAKAAGRHHE